MAAHLWAKESFPEKERPSQRNEEKLFKSKARVIPKSSYASACKASMTFLIPHCKTNMPSTSTAAARICWSERHKARAPLPASKWQRRNIALNSPLEVKPQSLCPFPRDCWRSRPVAMIMRLEFDRKASNTKTYGVNLEAPRLAHTREPAAQSLQANPRPIPLWACQPGRSIAANGRD